MKWTLVAVMVVLSLVLAVGCCNPPTSVKNALYTAQLTSGQTVKEASEALPGTVWNIPAGTSEADQIAMKDAQIGILVSTLNQVDVNLQTVSDYLRTAGTLFPVKPTPTTQPSTE